MFFNLLYIGKCLGFFKNSLSGNVKYWKKDYHIQRNKMFHFRVFEISDLEYCMCLKILIYPFKNRGYFTFWINYSSLIKRRFIKWSSVWRFTRTSPYFILERVSFNVGTILFIPLHLATYSCWKFREKNFYFKNFTFCTYFLLSPFIQVLYIYFLVVNSQKPLPFK
jgi:hypothetical protein